MFSNLVRDSTIHGLKYLVDEKNVILRFIWLICILASFSFAILIIYKNVENWENSPAVVSNVDNLEIEVNEFIITSRDWHDCHSIADMCIDFMH